MFCTMVKYSIACKMSPSASDYSKFATIRLLQTIQDIMYFYVVHIILIIKVFFVRLVRSPWCSIVSPGYDYFMSN